MLPVQVGGCDGPLPYTLTVTLPPGLKPSPRTFPQSPATMGVHWSVIYTAGEAAPVTASVAATNNVWLHALRGIPPVNEPNSRAIYGCRSRTDARFRECRPTRAACRSEQGSVSARR